jgi:hypothetical protein
MNTFQCSRFRALLQEKIWTEGQQQASECRHDILT